MPEESNLSFPTRSLKFWAGLVLKNMILSAVALYLLFLMLLAARMDGYIP